MRCALAVVLLLVAPAVSAERRRPDDALERVERVIARAERASDRGDDREAHLLLGRAFVRYRTDVDALLSIADTYRAWGKGRHELRVRARIVELSADPDHLALYGDLLWVHGHEARALAVWHRITRTGTAPAWAHHGDLLYAHGYAAAALASYERALAIDRDNIAASQGRDRLVARKN